MYRLLLQISFLTVFALTSAGTSAELVVYTSRKIITMETALPEADAVAVKNGRIFAVGNEKELESLAEKFGGRVDHSLSDKILLPGFIDPHVHPSLPAVLTQFPFLAPDDWSLPTGDFPGATDPAAYKQQLQALVARHSDDSTPFIAWGYHPLWHGDVYREQLNDWFGDQPVMLWHRSFHELIGNDAALAMLGVTGADVAGQAEIDWAKGHFWENGLQFLIPRLSFLFAPERYGQGMQNFIEMMHRGGVTTALDMGTGIFGNPPAEIDLIRRSAEGISAPGRIILTPIITDFLARGKSPQEALAEIEACAPVTRAGSRLANTSRS